MPQQFIGQSSSSLNNSISTAVILAAGRGERIARGEISDKFIGVFYISNPFTYPEE